MHVETLLNHRKEKAIWQRAKSNNLEWKQQLYESKFNSSQYQALYIKERIKNYSQKERLE